MGKLLNFSETAEFLKELGKEAKRFSKTALKKICKFQAFMFKVFWKVTRIWRKLREGEYRCDQKYRR